MYRIPSAFRHLRPLSHTGRLYYAESGCPPKASIARDSEVGARFATICFVGVGQDAELRELQRSIHFQLTGTPLPAALREESEVFAAIQAAAMGRAVLLIIVVRRPGEIDCFWSPLVSPAVAFALDYQSRAPVPWAPSTPTHLEEAVLTTTTLTGSSTMPGSQLQQSNVSRTPRRS